MDGETIDSEDMQGDGAKLAMSARDVSQMLPTSSTSSLRSSRYASRTRSSQVGFGLAAHMCGPAQKQPRSRVVWVSVQLEVGRTRLKLTYEAVLHYQVLDQVQK
jgi:hypothetical protein